MSIKVSKVNKYYGEQQALKEISFEINSGEIVGFIGPNGAGKSTMMKIICGVIPPGSGEVFIDGLDVMKQSLQIRKKIGYLPENNPLYAEMYIREYLEFSGGVHKIGSQRLKSRLREVIEQTGLEKEQHKKIGELSKGFRQRVGLAQALIHDPDILILDEPTTGLDPNQIIEIRNLISQAGKEKTVMLSTHILREVETICSRVIVINNGKIVANDKTDNIRKLSKEALHTIIVEFNAPVDKKILEEIPDIGNLKQVNELTWLIESSSDKELRARIFDFAVAHKIAVISMHKKEKSLEDVFRELTRSGE